jgi:hypothetical protein
VVKTGITYPGAVLTPWNGTAITVVFEGSPPTFTTLDAIVVPHKAATDLFTVNANMSTFGTISSNNALSSKTLLVGTSTLLAGNIAVVGGGLSVVANLTTGNLQTSSITSTGNLKTANILATGSTTTSTVYVQGGVFWAGNGLNILSGGSAASAAVGDTPPGSPSAGSLWWQSNVGALKVYYQGLNQNYWVDASPTSAVVSAGVYGQIQYAYSNGAFGAANISFNPNTGNVVISSVTTSTSTGTGALVVAGGAGIAGNLYVGSVTPSTSFNTGALVVSGGTAIAGNLYVGGNLVVANLITVTQEVITTTEYANVMVANTVRANTIATFGTGTYTVAGYGTGDIVLNNGTTDTPGIHFYYANNTNFGIDVANSGLRFVKNLDETGGTVTGYFDTFSNFFVANSIYATGDVVAAYSDDRLKTRVGDLTGALAAVNSLTGFKYVPNELGLSLGMTDQVRLGLSAQDVGRVYPEITPPAPFDIEVVDGVQTSKSGENYRTIDYEKMVPVLVESIKELTAMVVSLQEQLNGR